MRKLQLGYYILKGHEVVPVDNVLEWGEWFETAKRHVDMTAIGGVSVSTVFLGLDHRFSGDGPPIVFETLVFGGEHDGDMDRCSTWDGAVAMHRSMCEKVFGRN